MLLRTNKDDKEKEKKLIKLCYIKKIGLNCDYHPW